MSVFDEWFDSPEVKFAHYRLYRVDASEAFKAGMLAAAKIFELRSREIEGRSPARMILDRVSADIEKALEEAI
jgi:hypothetical protein